MKVCSTMLLKTNGERMPVCGLAKMLLKKKSYSLPAKMLMKRNGVSSDSSLQKGRTGAGRGQ